MSVSLLATIAVPLVTALLALFTFSQLRANLVAIRAQGVQMSIERNWRIVENWCDARAPRVDWIGRSREDMFLRMAVVNELSLVQWAFVTRQVRAMPREDLAYWLQKGERMLEGAGRCATMSEWMRGQIEFELSHYPSAMIRWLKPLMERHLPRSEM